MHFRQTGRTADFHHTASILLTTVVLALVAGIPAVAQELNHAFRYHTEHVEIIDAGAYDRVEYDGARADYDPRLYGYPELPVFIHRFLLPPETRIEELLFTNIETETLEGEFLPRPIEPESPPGEEPEPHGPLPEIYESENPYPEQPITITTEGEFRGYHLVTLKVYPVQFVGASGTLRAVTNMQIGASLRPMTAEEVESRHQRLRLDTRPLSERNDLKWIRETVLNPEDLWAYEPEGEDPTGPRTLSMGEDNPFGGFVPTEHPSLEGPPVRYVIITDSLDMKGRELGDGLMDEFQRLADWKTSKGVPAIVKSVTWIEQRYNGIDVPEKIRAFIKDAAAKWGTDYVLLGGGEDIVPFRLLGAPDSRWVGNTPLKRADPPADMYYSELDDNWNDDGDAYFGEKEGTVYEVEQRAYQDLCLGRLTVRDSLEASIVVNKILANECVPGVEGRPDTSYWTSFAVATGLVHTADATSETHNGIVLAEALIDSVEASQFQLDIERLYAVMPTQYVYCPENLQNVQCYAGMHSLLSGLSYQAYTSDNLADALASGQHLLWHREHSNRNILGGVSKITDTASCATESWQAACLTAFVAANEIDDHFTSDRADYLDTGHNLPIIFSSGCDTNWYDLDAISERFIRAPAGGAIAYIGGEYSVGAAAAADHSRNLFGRMFPEGDAHLGNAVRNAINSNDYPPVVGVLFPLLGDPELPLCWVEPDSLELAKSPAGFTYLGPRSVTITVTCDSSPVEGARVCMKQADNAYAIAWTDAAGQAEFEAFTPLDSTPTYIMATAVGYYPQLDSLTTSGTGFGSWHHVRYDGHTRDDNVTGGDGDDLFEAGETAEFGISVKNVSPGGATNLTGVWAKLWPTAPVTFDLALQGGGDEDYEPEDIYIGKNGAHPHESADAGGLTTPAWGNEFKIPSNWEAIRTEERWESAGIPSESRILLWRAQDGSYRLQTEYCAGDDSLFVGTLSTEGGFSDVLKLSGETADSLFFDEAANPDTLRFKFCGDGTADLLKFRAESTDWLAISPDSSYIGTLSSGATAEADFSVVTTEQVADEELMAFTVAVHDASGSWWHSDFTEEIHASELEVMKMERDIVRIGGTGYSGYFAPTIANLGTGDADSVATVLHITDFGGANCTCWDSSVTIGGIAASDTSVAWPDSFHVVCTELDPEVFDGFTYDLEVQVWYPNGIAIGDTLVGQDTDTPTAPTNLAVDDGSEGAVLTWSPSTSEDVRGYHVYRYVPTDTSRVTRAPLEGSARFAESGQVPFDAGGNYLSYRYAVSAVDASGNESEKVYSDTSSVWLPELEGWPKRVDTRSWCAPVACDVDSADADGLEVFAAGKAIYAWKANGDPLIAANDDGLFYDPTTDQHAIEDFAEVECFFYGALAIEDIDGDDNFEIVGNLTPYGVYVLEYDDGPPASVTKEWFCEVEAPLCTPTIADLDNDDAYEIILSGGFSSNLYVWAADGRTFQQTHNMTGIYGTANGGAKYNYGHVAVGEFDANSDGLEIIQTLGYENDSGNCVPRVTCWATADSVGSQLWTTNIGSVSGLVLSSPVIGDIDGDNDELEIAVSRESAEDWASHVGGIWLLDADGDVVNSIEEEDLFFRVEPAPTPALAERGVGEDNLEIYIANGRQEEPETYKWSRPIEMLVWEGDLSDTQSKVDTTTVVDYIPVPGRTHEHSIGEHQPAIGDIDGDENLEVIICNNSGYLACFDVGGDMEPEVGWPQRFHDIPLTPTIADIDANGYLDLIVVDRSGAVHALRLPGATDGADLPWPEFGHDRRNTSNYHTAIGSRGRSGPGASDVAAQYPARFDVWPSILQRELEVRFALTQRGMVDLSVLDIEGRCVKRILGQELAAGAHSAVWDGRDDGSRRLATGVYFIRLERAGEVDVRRLTVIQ